MWAWRDPGSWEPADRPTAGRYHTIRAMAQGGLRRPYEAIASARRALEFDDSNPETWSLLISTLMRTDQLRRALTEAIAS